MPRQTTCSRCLGVYRWATSQIPPLQIFVGVDMGWLQAVELPKTGLSCFGRALRELENVGNLHERSVKVYYSKGLRTFMLPFQSHFALESWSR